MKAIRFGRIISLASCLFSFGVFAADQPMQLAQAAAGTLSTTGTVMLNGADSLNAEIGAAPATMVGTGSTINGTTMFDVSGSFGSSGTIGGSGITSLSNPGTAGSSIGASSITGTTGNPTGASGISGVAGSIGGSSITGTVSGPSIPGTLDDMFR